MNLARPSAHRPRRAQPPLLRQFWLHRALSRQRAAAAECETDKESIDPTESGEPEPDDQT
jgi:hypothetical protein